ncbi:MAG: glutamine--fructose-6-phosphate transaminase (isomerizing) [Bacilli bacterium]|nr:glutamine--fructose-6-phosphate transaminase (isomerizing) [Bacilli bacterium]
MCGIVGYIGEKVTTEVLLKGIENLEYRGYDSAGIAIANENKIQIIREVGKVSKLKEKLEKEKLITSSFGIAHTRWATNGEVSLKNTHPHNVGKVTLVHNGIIENADKLKERLLKKGYVFKSKTDTEVVAALLDNYLKTKSEKQALLSMVQQLEGSFALVIMIEGKDYLYVVRNKSPLVIGSLKDEKYIASDIPAIAEFTKDYLLLEDLEIAKVTKEEVEVYDQKGKKVKRKVKRIDVTNEIIDKQGYEHFMLKEIMEEPRVLHNLLDIYLDRLDDLDISRYDNVHIVACGSAMYAGMIGKVLLEEKAHVDVTVEVASEYRYKKNIYRDKTLVILISQSGETADTIAALRIAKANHQDTLAIINTKNSTIDREADKTLYIEAGVEVAVATTKAYILQVALLSLMAYVTAKKKSLLDVDECIEVINHFKALPRLIQNILKDNELYKKIAKQLYKHDNIFFIGRKMDYAMCLEGSLKLKEISYIHSEAYPAGELKHGTISLIDKGLPVIAIMTDKKLKEKMLSNIKECEARYAKMFIITSEVIDEKDTTIVVKKTDQFTQTLLVVPILQMIAYNVALLRGCDIDKPKNLAKSVTVE